MRLGINQPTFLPWQGFFGLVDSVDEFIFLDDAQLANRSYVTRTNLYERQSQNFKLISLSLKKNRYALICDQTIRGDLFFEKHRNFFSENYRDAPYKNFGNGIIEYVYDQPVDSSLSQFNICGIQRIADCLGINTIFSKSSERQLNNLTGKNKLEALIAERAPCEYYNFAKGIEEGIHDVAKYKSWNVSVNKLNYNFKNYTPVHGLKGLSVLDLIYFNFPCALEIIRESTDWIKS